MITPANRKRKKPLPKLCPNCKAPVFTSKYFGVSKNKNANTFRAFIMAEYIGSFKSEEEAARAVDSAIVERGLEIRLNFPEGAA